MGVPVSPWHYRTFSSETPYCAAVVIVLVPVGVQVFPLTEKLRVQFRAEAFNATNTPVFGLPNVSFGSANFGVITAQANSPRQMQLALRLFY